MKNNRPGGGGGENIHIRIFAQFLCRLLCDLEQILCWNLITAALRVTISSFLRKNIYLLKKFFLKTESFYAWVRGTISWLLFILKILLLLSTSPTSTTMHIYIREGRGSTESLAQEEERNYKLLISLLPARKVDVSATVEARMETSLCLKGESRESLSGRE